jgi:hypothetical protein
MISRRKSTSLRRKVRSDHGRGLWSFQRRVDGRRCGASDIRAAPPGRARLRGDGGQYGATTIRSRLRARLVCSFGGRQADTLLTGVQR